MGPGLDHRGCRMRERLCHPGITINIIPCPSGRVKHIKVKNVLPFWCSSHVLMWCCRVFAARRSHSRSFCLYLETFEHIRPDLKTASLSLSLTPRKSLVIHPSSWLKLSQCSHIHTLVSGSSQPIRTNCKFLSEITLNIDTTLRSCSRNLQCSIYFYLEVLECCAGIPLKSRLLRQKQKALFDS